MQVADPATIVQTAVRAAREAGKLLDHHAGRALRVDKADRHDIKLEVDRLAENTILTIIRDTFPDHAVLAEETGESDHPEATFLWIVDPLDGTVNYYHGLPYYCTSIACYRRTTRDDPPDGPLPTLGVPVAAAVYAPPTNELFVAAHNQGATLNNKPIHVGNTAELDKVMFATGFGKDWPRAEEMPKVATAAASHVQKVRCLGAAAYDICNVAAGRLGGFFEGALKTWDIAAAGIVLTEAGGVLQATEFKPNTWRVLAATSSLARPLAHTLDL